MSISNWAFTVKNNMSSRKESYDEIWAQWEKYFPQVYVTTRTYEFDAKSRLHYHGIVRLSNNFYRGKLSREGFHLHLQELKTPDQKISWERYIDKDQDIQNLTPEPERVKIPKGKLFIKLKNAEEKKREFHKEEEKEVC